MKWSVVSVFMFLAATACIAQSKYSTDTGECGGDVRAAASISKTPVRISHAGSIRMYGILEFRHNETDAKANHCHVIYRLLVSSGNGAFVEAHRLVWDTEEGEIAGIDLIGFSPDGSKAAANLWLAAGDGVVNRPVVYDMKTKTAIFAVMPDVEDKRVPQESCDDDPYESLDSVTDAGTIIVSVPAIEGCADGGLWSFDPKAVVWKRIRLYSGRKPIK